MREENNKYVSNKIFTITALIIILSTFFVFLPSINNGFVNWDDIDYVYENTNIRSLDPQTIKWAFTAKVVENWYPLTLLSYALDYKIWGKEAWGYHLTNVFLHSCNAFLVFILTALLVTIGKNESRPNIRISIIAAVFAALFFSLHPLRVESVTWISGRKDVLSGFFTLFSVICYVLYVQREERGKNYYAFSVLFFAMALMSKPTAIMLPFVLILMDWYPLQRFNAKNSLKEKIPFFLCSALSAFMTMWAIYGSAKTAGSVQSGLLQRVFSVVYTNSFYFVKTIFPYGLSPLYPWPEINLITPGFIGGVLLLTVITVACVLSKKTGKAPLAAWLCFLIMLFPVTGMLKFGRQIVADRFTYLPVISICVLAGIYAAKREKKAAIGKVKIIIIAAICLLLAVLSVKQMHFWKDSLTLWTRQIELYPGQSDVAYINRGSAYYVNGEYALAIKDFDAAIELKTENKDVFFNRGYARYYTGDYRGAFEDFKNYVRYDKNDAKTFLDIGKKFLNDKDHKNAIIALDAARRLDPELTEAATLLKKASSDKKR